MDAVVAHPDIRGLERLTLATNDAHGLYRQYGFELLDHPERWMLRRSAGPAQAPGAP